MTHGNVESNNIILKLKHMISRAVIDEGHAKEAYNIDAFFHRRSRCLVAELSRYVASQRLDMINVPADWWSGLKLALFGEGYWYILPLKAPEMVRFTLDANYPEYPIDPEFVGKPYLEIKTTAYSMPDWKALAD